ncbi:YHYH domain-containing protein [Paenibacillus sp. HWE-109]|uniref:YHYH domain-containing protein n=1 Tax=Paenibacillus sp. HWE-109 TaxID=1306526 RepID=UPI001EDFB9AD|nr:YHYH domain-containing protein [Paenibacillus sp. HWE-109]UKS26658.1 YHYH domain-containing protein [Paenibacillus sp. HWE-109]
MKLKKIGLTLLSFMITLSVSQSVYAHSGRTDANGGHNCSAASKAKGLCTGYHYHNGGSSSGSSGGGSSSGGSTSNNKPAEPVETVPSGQVKVSKPTYSIYVNGTSVPNSSLKYPIISYKDITYFPMTYKFTQALALETVWDADVGFVIRKTANKAGKLELDSGSTSANLYASKPDFNIYVNDVWIDNNAEEYPLLVLNDVTYFPMTWHYAVDELGLTIKLENNAFYISK